MDLRDVRGVGRATEEKLNAAGIHTAAELAWVEDIDALAARSGIPAPRLAALRHEAARADHRPAPPPHMAWRRLVGSTNRLGTLLLEKMGLRSTLLTLRELGSRSRL